MNLAPSLYVLGDRAGARKAIEEALAIAEHTYPKDDPRLVGYLENAALIARDDDRLAEALADFQRVEQIVEKANGPDAAAAESLGYIALTYMVMGKLPEAQAACARSLTALEKVYGADSPYVGSALGDCGSVQLEQNDAVAALASYDKAKTLLEAKLGKDHSSVGHALSGRAKALVRLKRESEAITDVERALAIANSTKAGPGELAELHFTLAMALSAKPATRARARAEANVAIAAYEKADDKTALAKTRAWLRAH
jgi:tetratricopeptide (TPR) repeat protein